MAQTSVNELDKSSPLYWETECNGQLLEVEDVSTGVIKEVARIWFLQENN